MQVLGVRQWSFDGGTIILFISFGARNIFGILLDPMTESTGLSVGDFSFAIGLQAVIWGLTTPITASLAERYGTARMIALGGVLYAAGLILMSLVQIPIHMNLTAGLMLGLGLSATGFPIILAAVTKRVDAKRRSFFLGIGSAAGHRPACAGADWPVFYQRIRLGGHRDNLRLLVALIVPLASAMRDPKREAADPNAAPEQKLTEAVGEAMSHRGFPPLAAGYFVCGYQVMFLGTHLPNFLTEAGQDPWVGATALSLIGLFNIFGTLAWGAMGGKWRMKYLLTIDIPVALATRRIYSVASYTVEHLHLRVRHRPAMAGHRAADIRPGRTDIRPAIHGHTDRYRVLQSPAWQLRWRLAGGSFL